MEAVWLAGCMNQRGMEDRQAGLWKPAWIGCCLLELVSNNSCHTMQDLLQHMQCLGAWSCLSLQDRVENRNGCVSCMIRDPLVVFRLFMLYVSRDRTTLPNMPSGTSPVPCSVLFHLLITIIFHLTNDMENHLLGINTGHPLEDIIATLLGNIYWMMVMSWMLPREQEDTVHHREMAELKLQL